MALDGPQRSEDQGFDPHIRQELKTENMFPEIANTFYSGDAEHDMYIGEIVDIELH